MDDHVFFQIERHMGCVVAATVWAMIDFILDMAALVYSQIILSTGFEAAVIILALEGFLSFMGKYVRFQMDFSVTFVGAALVVAFKALYLVMAAFVLSQIVLSIGHELAPFKGACVDLLMIRASLFFQRDLGPGVLAGTFLTLLHLLTCNISVVRFICQNIFYGKWIVFTKYMACS